ncbi:hypothetical protein [Staphylococcus epidermidis]|uniref:hypothetical protein n=1 Tax=Staphylococcus epidermidis TaxID=1282 RepID=UPI0037DA6ED8
MPTKLLSNQFLPIQHLPKPTPLSQHPKPITSLFLLSFPNFTSIPIISPPIKSFNHQKPHLLPPFPIKLLFPPTLLSFISPPIPPFFI